MDYILFMFAKSDKQEDFVETLCKDISVMSDLGDVRYYYGPESVILTFKCSEDFGSINDFMNLLYGKMDLVYILLPYSSDKMSLKMSSDITKHLFNIDLPNEDSEKMSESKSMVQKLLEDVIGSEELMSIFKESEDEESFIDKVVNKISEKQPSLDELLDKINSQGILALSEKELTLLNNYSKQ